MTELEGPQNAYKLIPYATYFYYHSETLPRSNIASQVKETIQRETRLPERLLCCDAQVEY